MNLLKARGVKLFNLVAITVTRAISYQAKVITRANMIKKTPALTPIAIHFHLFKLCSSTGTTDGVGGNVVG